MHVLIVSPYRAVAPHFEHELEIAQRHIDRGDRVSFLSCWGELPGCDFNPNADKQACQDCRLRRKHGLTQLSARVNSQGFDRRASENSDGIPAHLPESSFENIESLKVTRVDQFDVGYATLSSAVSQVRDPEIDLASYMTELKAFSDAALRVYRQTIDWLNQNRPDRVYVFNGRFAAMRAVLRACQSVGVECLIHERGCDTHHFQLFRNRLPHNIDYIESRMRNHWNQAAGKKDRPAKAREWFQGRLNRVEKNWHSFVKQQERGRLPDGWDTRLHNIVVFTSSEDEFVAIGDSWTDRLYQDQGDGVFQLAQRLLVERPDALLTVRMHPNQMGIDNANKDRLANLDMPNVRVIPPEDTIDSYELMRVADSVATFGSSIGIESVFWSKPSVLLGPSFYQNLQGPFRADSHEHAIRLLSSDLVPVSRHEALVYGYWHNTHGIACKYFEPNDDLFTGKFKGEVIYARPEKRLSDYVSRRLLSIRKRMLPKQDRHAA